MTPPPPKPRLASERHRPEWKIPEAYNANPAEELTRYKEKEEEQTEGSGEEKEGVRKGGGGARG